MLVCYDPARPLALVVAEWFKRIKGGGDQGPHPTRPLPTALNPLDHVQRQVGEDGEFALAPGAIGFCFEGVQGAIRRSARARAQDAEDRPEHVAEETQTKKKVVEGQEEVVEGQEEIVEGEEEGAAGGGTGGSRGSWLLAPQHAPQHVDLLSVLVRHHVAGADLMGV